MNYKIFACLLLVLATTASGRVWYHIQNELGHTEGTNMWFDSQLIDHFNPLDQRTFAQRYWVVDDVYKQGGPIFLYICGEATCRGAPGNKSFVYTLAQKAGALIVALEHRYYGKSQPFGKDSMKTKNLVHLTVENALEDLAYFIRWFRDNSKYHLTESQKWITIGGSYPGALSAWFRAKYPHLTAGAWSSSGVVNSILDYDLYDYQVFLSTSRSGPECPKTIQNLTTYFETQLYHDPNYKLKFGEEAKYLTNEEILYLIADAFASPVQYGTRVDMCQLFANATDFDDLVNKTITSIINSLPLTFYGVHFVKNETLTEANDDDLGRQWLYQTCTQLGWFQTANNISAHATRSPRVNINHFKQFCEDVFGEGVWPKDGQFNWDFGSVNLQATNIVYAAGSEDPWTWACKNFTTGTMTSVYANCDRCGHCVDLGGENEKTSESLKEVHRNIESLILGYVGVREQKLDSKYGFLSE